MRLRFLLIAIVGTIGACLGLSRLHAQTQREMNEASCAKFDGADRALNAVYKQLLVNGTKDQEFLANLRRAQKAWLAFRDAQIRVLYGARDNTVRYGTVWPMCACDAKTSLTADRTKQLQAMLDWVEGDVCSWARP